MPLSTYSELKSAVADFLNRDDLTAVIPTFVALTEADINRTLRDYRMETRAALTLDTRYEALPADWLETIRLELSGQTHRVELVSNAAMSDMRRMRADLVGTPTSYCHTAGQLELYPTPDKAYAAELVYFGKAPALSDAAPTNWLLTAAPDAYLYGALTQSAPYLKDDQRAVVWAGLYQNAINSLNSASERARYSGSGLRLMRRGLV